MTKRNFPHIRLTSQSYNGNYYAAYPNDDENVKLGYHLFIAHTEKTQDFCECMAYVHGKPCYHIIRAKELEVSFCLE